MSILDLALSDPAPETLFRSEEHGDPHWRSVAAIGAVIAKRNGGSVPMAILFGALHDRYRENEFHDPDHGLRAAEAASRLGISRALGEAGTVFEHALREHDTGKTTSDPIVGSCWDADRLTLVRFGATIDQRFISVLTPSGLADFMPSAKMIIDAPPSWGRLRDIFERTIHAEPGTGPDPR